MDFAWTPEQQELRKRIIRFAEKELTHSVYQHDRDGTFPYDSWQKCADFGILGGNVPEAYGGSGRDILTNVMIMEAIGYGCRDNGFTLALNAQLWAVQHPILEFASEEQKQAFLPELVAGRLIGAFAITEPNAGSDAFSMETSAVREGDAYLLNGRKHYIGFSPIADFFIVFARTDPKAGAWGISAFLVDAKTEGLTRGANSEKMGTRTMPMGEVMFKDCRIPVSSRLGGEGVGMSLFNDTMDWERSFILAGHVGAMAKQLDICIDYAKTRKQFGKAIGSYQSVSNRIADMRVRLETSRLLMYQAASLKDKGEKAALEARMANLHIAESFLASSLDAIRIHGGKGYLSEFEIERDLRDSVGGVIYSGTSDIQRNLISRILGL